jgi:probable FeS assembly SUF system protein SufT
MQGWNERVTLSRDIEATQVPYGYSVALKEGTPVTITQALGGLFTIVTDEGVMCSISGKDVDAIGKEVGLQKDEPMPEINSIEDVEKVVWDQLRTCYDPEIPVNIADLGLIYGVQVKPREEEDGNKVDIQMTLTAPGCGMGEILKIEVEHKVMKIPTVKDVEVELVFDPPWDMSMLPEAAKLQLGML